MTIKHIAPLYVYQVILAHRSLCVWCGHLGSPDMYVFSFTYKHMNPSSVVAAEAPSCEMHISPLSRRRLSKLAVTSLSTRAPG